MEKHLNNNHRSSNRNLVWGGLLILLGGLFLFDQLMPSRLSSLIPTVILGGIGVTFLSVYLMNRQHWWALIPAYTFGAVAGIVLLADFWMIPGEWIGAYVMYAVAFPFFYVYLMNRQHWWALIPAYTFGIIGSGLILGELFRFNGEFVGAFVMFAIAFPFFYVFFHNREHWWALIPGGIMGSIGLGLLVGGIMNSMAPMIPVVLIAAGLFLLFQNMRREPTKVVSEERAPQFEPIHPAPQSSPETDRPQPR